METPRTKAQFQVDDDAQDGKSRPRRGSSERVFSSSPVRDGESAIPSLPKLASEHSMENNSANQKAVEEQASHVSGAGITDGTDEKEPESEKEQVNVEKTSEDPDEEPEKVDNRARLMQPEVIPVAPGSDDASGADAVRKILAGLPSEPSSDDLIEDSDDDLNYETCGDDSIGQFESCGSLGSQTDGDVSGPAE